MSDKRTSLAAIEKVLEDMPRTGVPDGISLADNRVDRSGFDGLIDLPVYEHDTIVPTWGYAPIPSASAFTLISREGGRVTGHLFAGFEVLHGSVCVYAPMHEETYITLMDRVVSDLSELDLWDQITRGAEVTDCSFSMRGGPIGIVEVIVDDEPKRPPSGSRRSGSSKNVGAGGAPPPYERLGLVNEFGDGNMILRAPSPEAEP